MGDLHHNPGSAASLALMKGWIDKCQRSHQSCKIPQQVGGPKRLLECLSNGSVRLVETQSLTQRCEYIALSYCWGDGTAVMKTTEKNPKNTLRRHRHGIPEKSLPPLFQEAVSLARGLNIPYLWIDSMCIIQDSDKDKKEEIMRMCDIFRGAFIVVVAASAESPLDSLLSVMPQPDQSQTWCTSLKSLLRVKPQSGQSHTCCTALKSLLRVKPQSGQTHTRRTALNSQLRVKLQSGRNTWRALSRIGYQEVDFVAFKFRKRAWRAHFSTNATDSTQTGKRAWCFQEKLLASRCLVFHDDEVVWECRSCCLCECGGEQEHFSGDKSPMKPYRQMLLPLAEHEPFQLDGPLTAFAQLPFAEHETFQLDGTLKYFADAEGAYSFWETAVEDYSRRALTLRTDHLPAISAVASIIAVATGDRYLAGLWRDDLLAGLGWVLSGLVPWSGAPQKYIAPTWSWASLSQGVRYPSKRTRHSRDSDLDASVLEAWTALKDQNPYGEVSDAAIVLSGLQCDAELTIRNTWRAQLDFWNGDVQKVDLGTGDLKALDSMLVESDTSVDWVGGNSRYLRRITDPQTNRQPACSGAVRLLWLEKDVSLILTPSRQREGAYERLGIFHQGIDHRPEIYRGSDDLKMPKTVQRSSIKLI